MNKERTGLVSFGGFAMVSAVAWILIFGLTVSESLFYYKIHEQPAPYKRIILNDFFILFWVPLSPFLFKLLHLFYQRKKNWFLYGIKAAVLCVIAILLILSAETFQHFISEANEIKQKSYTNIFIQIVTLRFQTNLILSLGFISSCVAYLVYNESQMLARKQEELNKSLLTAQLGVLKAQMKPHFLFNSLHAISGLILKQKNDLAITVISRLSELLRESIDMDSKRWITIREELDFIKRYLDIYQLRFGDQLKSNFEIDDDVYDCLIPPAILQPIVENSIVHGIVPNNNEGTIFIEIKKLDADIYLSVWDTTDNPQIVDGEVLEGLGLSNTRKRLSSLFGNAYKVNFNKDHSKTEIIIPIVLQEI